MHKEKHKNTKQAYTNGSKKLSFAVVFTRRGFLLIHTAEMTAIKVVLKEIYKREDKKMGNIYRFSELSIHSIAYNKENHPMLNQIHHILAELQSQDKKIA